jgi:hypothetical protein
MRKTDPAGNAYLPGHPAQHVDFPHSFLHMQAMIATFDSTYNASLYEAAERDPHLLATAVRYLRTWYTFDRLTPEHIRWAVKVIRSQREGSSAA